MSKYSDLTMPRTLLFNGKGGATELDENIAVKKDVEKKAFWQHLDYQDSNVYNILLDDYHLDQTVVEALIDEDTRPRFFAHNDGLVIILRGVNLNKGSDPEDMISLRIWLDEQKIITLSHRKIKAIADVINSFEENRGPNSTIQCFLNIADKLSEDIEIAVADITEDTNDLEEEVIDIDNLKDFQLRARLSDLRRKIIAIRRYIAPQREMLTNLQANHTPLLSAKNKLELREINNRIIKLIEDLDYCKDHLAISHEELQSKISISMSKIMYMISIVTMIFLPLSLITGLLGINVKGIPLAEENYGFLAVCIILLTICGVLIALMKKLRWI